MGCYMFSGMIRTDLIRGNISLTVQRETQCIHSCVTARSLARDMNWNQETCFACSLCRSPLMQCQDFASSRSGCKLQKHNARTSPLSAVTRPIRVQLKEAMHGTVPSIARRTPKPSDLSHSTSEVWKWFVPCYETPGLLDCTCSLLRNTIHSVLLCKFRWYIQQAR
jgi:hypothetical protein